MRSKGDREERRRKTRKGGGKIGLREGQGRVKEERAEKEERIHMKRWSRREERAKEGEWRRGKGKSRPR